MSTLPFKPETTDTRDELAVVRPKAYRGPIPFPGLAAPKTLALGRELDGQSAFTEFFSNFRDAIFPRRLPPLDLQSQPIAVADPLAVRRDPRSSLISAILHIAIAVLLVWFAMQARQHFVAPKKVAVVPIQFQPPIPITVPAPKTMGGGGGGGARQIVPPTRAKLPPVEKTPMMPVETLKVDHPRLVAKPAIAMPKQIRMPMTPQMPMLGMPASPQVAVVSQGSGSGGGFGVAHGGGIGGGLGSGVGPGTGAGYGGGVMSVGGGVSAPRLIHSVEPEYTDAARQARKEGTVSIQLIVDPRGLPEDVHVVKSLGMGLDQKAVEAVHQYRFAPAMYRGQPVAVQMVIDVAFHLD
jgi:protein TonB